MTRQLQVVTFDQAIKLKKMGFNWGCGYFYNESKSNQEYRPNFVISNDELLTLKDFIVNSNYNRYSNNISAPTVALALKWFRDEKNIKNEVRFYYTSNDFKSYYYQGYLDNNNHEQLSATKCYETYEEAEKALLNELINLSHENK